MEFFVSRYFFFLVSEGLHRRPLLQSALPKTNFGIKSRGIRRTIQQQRKYKLYSMPRENMPFGLMGVLASCQRPGRSGIGCLCALWPRSPFKMLHRGWGAQPANLRPVDLTPRRFCCKLAKPRSFSFTEGLFLKNFLMALVVLNKQQQKRLTGVGRVQKKKMETILPPQPASPPPQRRRNSDLGPW